MQDFRKSVWSAVVTAVRRVGPDLVVTLRDAQPGTLRQGGTVTFERAGDAAGVDVRNGRSAPPLTPGWSVDGLTHADGVARLQVSWKDERESYPVLYTITCGAIRVALRPSLGRSLLALVGR